MFSKIFAGFLWLLHLFAVLFVREALAVLAKGHHLNRGKHLIPIFCPGRRFFIGVFNFLESGLHKNVRSLFFAREF